MGADRGIHIETTARTDQDVQPLAVAKAFKFLAEVSQISTIRGSFIAISRPSHNTT